jgi:hypothetical protein
VSFFIRIGFADEAIKIYLPAALKTFNLRQLPER